MIFILGFSDVKMHFKHQAPTNQLKLCVRVCISMGTNCAPLVADLFYVVMRETSRCLFLTIIKQMLLKHLTLSQDI